MKNFTFKPLFFGICIAFYFAVSLWLPSLGTTVTYAATRTHADSCYSDSCNGNDPYWNGCTSSAIAKDTLNVTASETILLMYSLTCNAVYAEIDLPGTTIDIDADIQSGSLLYHSGFQAISPTRSPMIGLGSGGSYTYTATGCYGSQDCQSFSYAFPDLSSAPSSDQSAQLKAKLGHLATLVPGDTLDNIVNALSFAEDQFGCANAINEAQAKYVGGLTILIFFNDIASPCGKAALEQIAQDLEAVGVQAEVDGVTLMDYASQIQ